MTEPLVSIIIPCYNAEKYVAESIQSALDQTYPHCEVIVIDDGSTDGSLDVIKSFGDRIRWETGPNRGGCAARNRGLELAKGRYVKYLDADDVLKSGIVSIQVKIAADLPPDAVPFGIAIDFDNGQAVYNEIVASLKTSREEMIQNLYVYNILTSCPLHSADLLRSIGGFDISLRRGQETDLHIRLALAGCLFVKHDDICYRYRDHDGFDRISNSYARRGCQKDSQYAMEKSLRLLEAADPPLTPSLIKSIRLHKSYQLLRSYARRGLREESDVLAVNICEMLRLCDVRFDRKYSPARFAYVYVYAAKWISPVQIEQFLRIVKVPIRLLRGPA